MFVGRKEKRAKKNHQQRASRRAKTSRCLQGRADGSRASSTPAGGGQAGGGTARKGVRDRCREQPAAAAAAGAARVGGPGAGDRPTGPLSAWETSPTAMTTRCVQAPRRLWAPLASALHAPRARRPPCCCPRRAARCRRLARVAWPCGRWQQRMRPRRRVQLPGICACPPVWVWMLPRSVRGFAEQCCLVARVL
jgi:hypothetical protein